MHSGALKLPFMNNEFIVNGDVYMKNKRKTLKSIIALLLCFLMATGAAVPAFAMDDYEFDDNNIDINDYDDVLGNKGVQIANELVEYNLDRLRAQSKQLSEQILKKETATNLGSSTDYRAFLESYVNFKNPGVLDPNVTRAYDDWANLSTAFSIFQGISSIVCAVSSAISLLQMMGVMKGEPDPSVAIMEQLGTLKSSVDELDRKVDAIQDTLVNEFAELDLKLQNQDYNHYKDDVWAKFYTDAVVPLNNIQTEYSIRVNDLLLEYIDPWQKGENKTDLRALMGRNEENGEIMQVYSGRNLRDPGRALPQAPEVSLDGLPVEYSIVLPAEYITGNIDKEVYLTSDNCIAVMRDALTKGVYQAAEKGELSAYYGFENEWLHFTEEEKQATAKEFAGNLADALAFACSYNAVNEKGFTSSVRNAYLNFTKWLQGSESLTSPLTAQLKMLSLSHVFEGEITESIDEITLYLCLMNQNFYNFTQTILSMSKSQSKEQMLEVSNEYYASEIIMSADYTNFLTGNPNYCYVTGSVIEYKDLTLESTMKSYHVQFDDSEFIEENENTQYAIPEGFTTTRWKMFEKGTPDSQKEASQEDLMARTITPKQAKIIYAMYETAKTGIDFSNFLVDNSVAATTEQISRSGIITSVDTENFDLSKENIKMTCYLPSNHGTYAYTPGKQYTVKSGVANDLNVDSNYRLHDMATGGLFDLTTGDFNENAPLEYRVYYHGTRTDSAGKEYKVHRLIAFSTADFSSKDTRLEYGSDELRNLGGDWWKYTCGRTESVFTSDRYGMLVSSELSTYTFTVDTKKIGSQFFGKTVSIDKMVFNGTPESIADDAFKGIGSTDNRCLLSAPFATGSLVGKWHGGYFGDIQITVEKNDGSGEKETVIAATGEKVSDVVCTFTAPEYAIFDGWSLYPNGTAADSNETVTSGMTLYAKWKYDHEHDFEVTKEAVAATCTENGSTEEKTCKTCGYKDVKVIPATGHTCEYSKTYDGEYIAECKQCDYNAHLYPRTFGFQTVWSENKTGDDVIYISGAPGETCIEEDGVYVIESNEPPFSFLDDAQAVYVKDGINANICFVKVKLTGSVTANGLNIGKANVRLTLNGENTIASEESSAFLCAGNLVIDGTGGLTVSGDDTYTPMICTGENTVINGGCIKVEGGKNFSVEINKDKTGGKLVITENTSVLTDFGIDSTAVNENGEKVYPVLIPNEYLYSITVDGKELPDSIAKKDGEVCIYLTDEEHEITVGDEPFYWEPIDDIGYFEKEYGDFTVLNPALDEKAVEYSLGVLTVRKSTPITIKNTDPTTSTTDRIVIAKDVNADITLDGVSIQTGSLTGKNAITPILITENSRGAVKITLAEGSENVLVAGNNHAAISKNGEYGTLTIDGTGSLSATGGMNAAAIGSTPGKPVAGIIIDGGNIEAIATGEGAAAIGAGKNETFTGGNGHYLARNIVINGGYINAVSDSVAIGAEYLGTSAGEVPLIKDIIINGGTVIAQSGTSDYTIGSEYAENVRINGGVVTAEGTAEGKGGIGSADHVIIENTASVKTSRVVDPVNSLGKTVSLNTIKIGANSDIHMNGKDYKCTGHNGEDKIYLYLAANDRVAENPRVECEQSDRGVVFCSPAHPKPGDEVTLIPAPYKGYSFVDYEITPAVEIKDDTFIMPNTPLTIKGIFAKVGTVTVTESEHGRVMPSKSLVSSGEKVTLRAMPDDGYELDTLTVTPVSLEADGKSFIMPEEDVTVTCTFKEKTCTVTWNVDGETDEEEVIFGNEIIKPENPNKDGFIFKGWTPDIPEYMPDADLEFFAVFEPITYTAKFIADGTEIGSVEYNLSMVKPEEPAVPEKTGYTGKWEEYTLTAGGITVEAEYTPIEYTARFIADGELVKNVAYTIETLSIEEPTVPEKSGYTGAWSEYSLTVGGITVKAVYTSSVHEHTFSAKHSFNEAAHWFASTCGHDVASCLEPHTFDAGTIEGNVIRYSCTKCDYVETVVMSEDYSDNLATIISDAKDAIDLAAAGGDDAVLEYADEAKNAIEKLTLGSEVTKKLAEVISTINKMKTEAAIADALDTLDNAAASTSKGQSIVRMAKLLVSEAKSPEEVNAILADALTKLEAEESAAADVAEAKTAAKDAIAEMAGEKQSDEMKSIITDVESVIDAAQTAEQVAAALELGEAAVQTQLDKEAAEASLEEAKASLTEAQTALTEAKNALKEKTEALDAAEEKLKEVNDALEQAKKDLDAKDEAIRTAEENLAAAQDELEKTKSELEEKAEALNEAKLNLLAANTALEKANNQVETLTADLKEVNDELTETKSALGTAEGQIETLTEELRSANSELTKTKGELDAANEQVKTLTADLNEANDELTETKTALDKAETDLETAANEKAVLESQLADKETELENLRKSGEAKDEEISALEGEIVELEKAIETKDGEITAKTGEIAALNKSVDELEKAVEDKNRELAEKSDAVAELENSVSELENTVKEKKEEIAEKEKTIGDLEKSISNLEASVQAKETEVAEKAKEIKSLENNIKNLETEVTEAQKEIAGKNSQIEELTEQLEEAKAEIEELKGGPSGHDDTCPKCGKVHKDDFWGKIVCFFNRIFNFFRDLF